MTVLTIRSCKRYAVRQAAGIKDRNGERSTGLLIELSQEGGRISGLGGANLTCGDAIVLELDDQTLPGTVRWARPEAIGVRFDVALHTTELTALLARSKSKKNATSGLAAA
jgi:hypothetical protein